MRITITGATSLPGLSLLDVLLREGHEVRCIVRAESPNRARLGGRNVEVVSGDATDEASLARALDGVNALAHVAGVEFAPQVVAGMRRAGVERLLVFSSTSVHSRYEFRSGPKHRGEEAVQESNLAWTIVRPTMIYGSELDKNIHRLLRFLDRSPLYPVFGDGKNLWQPVYHEDLARGALSALISTGTVGRAYDLPGADPLTYRDLVLTAAEALGRKVRLVRVPLEPACRALRLAEDLRLPLPVKSEQVLRLREDKAYPYEDAKRDLGYSPRAFTEGVKLEAARLREIGLVRA